MKNQLELWSVNLLEAFVLRSIKEINDLAILDAGVKSISEIGQDDLMPHFIYCGLHYLSDGIQHMKFRKMILKRMRKYGVQSSILTMLGMERRNLVTNEKVKKAAEGKLENDEDWKRYEGSINDDLERFFTRLQNQKEVKEEDVYSFFTPKLTNEELKLVKKGNEEHFRTYGYYIAGKNPDVDVEEMKKSNSKSKFVHGRGFRYTISLTLETTELENSIPDAKKSKNHK